MKIVEILDTNTFAEYFDKSSKIKCFQKDLKNDN